MILNSKDEVSFFGVVLSQLGLLPKGTFPSCSLPGWGLQTLLGFALLLPFPLCVWGEEFLSHFPAGSEGQGLPWLTGCSTNTLLGIWFFFFLLLWVKAVVSHGFFQSKSPRGSSSEPAAFRKQLLEVSSTPSPDPKPFQGNHFHRDWESANQ